MKTLLNSLVRVMDHPLNRRNPINAIFRITAWKINQLTFRFPVAIRLTRKTKCICHPDSSYGGLVVYTRLPDYDEMTYLLNHLHAGDCFIDIGANIGVYTLLASSVISKGQIIAFEPFPKSAERLKNNIKINGITNVRIISRIVSDKSGYEEFGIEKESETNHISYGKRRNGTVRISSTTLDDFLIHEKIKQIDFLKIDVEGAEMKVLKGSQASLKKGKIRNILMELNRNNRYFGTSNKKVVRLLMQNGYRVYEFSDGKRRRVNDFKNIRDDAILNILATLDERL